jgi:hypothetical protein
VTHVSSIKNEIAFEMKILFSCRGWKNLAGKKIGGEKFGGKNLAGKNLAGKILRDGGK